MGMTSSSILLLKLFNNLKTNNMTAVEWLEWEINRRGPKENNPPQWLKELYEQAKQMEKQQIIDAFQYKFFHPYVENEPEKYYNETYKKDNL